MVGVGGEEAGSGGGGGGRHLVEASDGVAARLREVGGAFAGVR